MVRLGGGQAGNHPDTAAPRSDGVCAGKLHAASPGGNRKYGTGENTPPQPGGEAGAGRERGRRGGAVPGGAAGDAGQAGG